MKLSAWLSIFYLTFSVKLPQKFMTGGRWGVSFTPAAKGWASKTTSAIVKQERKERLDRLGCTGSRYRPRFFDQVGHQTTSAYIENKHFSLSQTYPKLWTTSSKFAKFGLSKSFLGIKNHMNLSDFFSVKNIWLGD